MTRRPPDLRSLDMLRGALALYVLLGHSRWLLWTGHAAWMAQPHEAWQVPLVYLSASLRFGREAVMVFFVLSGFFIHLRATGPLREGTALSFSATGFYRRRAHRLVAPYLFALVVTVVCDAVGRHWFPRLYASATGDALLDGTFALTGYGMASVLPALMLLPRSFGRDFGSNGPLWSLAFETIYYALYPGWLALRRRHLFLAYGLVPALCLALAALPGSSFLAGVLIYYPLWLAGAALAERAFVLSQSRAIVVGSAATFAAGLLLSLLTPSVLVSVIASVLFGVAAVVGWAALPEAWTRRRLMVALEFLGVRSYTLYIVHFPFLVLVGAWVFESQGARPRHGWLATAGAALAVAFGCACFEVCERHFLHHVRVTGADA